MRFLVTNGDRHICDSCGHLHIFFTRGCVPVAFDNFESAAGICRSISDGAAYPVAILEDPTQVVPLFPDVAD